MISDHNGCYHYHFPKPGARISCLELCNKPYSTVVVHHEHIPFNILFLSRFVSFQSSNKLARSVSSPTSSRGAGGGGRGAASGGANASLLDALSLSTAAMEECRQMRRKSLAPLEPQVPRLVSACFRHLEKNGMHVLGIFRVGGSKKRIRQVRRVNLPPPPIRVGKIHT